MVKLNRGGSHMSNSGRSPSALAYPATRLFVFLAAISLCLVLLPGCAPRNVTGPGTPPMPTAQARLGESVQFSVDEFWGTAEFVSTASLSDGLTVDTLHRETSTAFYQQYYLASEGVDIGWTGSYASCTEGSTSQAFRNAVLLRINYFRAMAGVPASIALDDEMNTAAQKAALLMAANGRVSHAPGPDWLCYSEQGDQAAGSSNLYAGVYGWWAIDGYMNDSGDANYHVPHRRWLLYPNTRIMGTGDIPPETGYLGANALLVWGPRSKNRPQTRDGFVAWPPPGYVPYSVVYPRWSFSYPDGDFSQATLSMTYQDEGIPLTVFPLASGFGENTVVWEPQIPIGVAPERDLWYWVHLNDVSINGVSTDFTYVVIVFDPATPYRP